MLQLEEVILQRGRRERLEHVWPGELLLLDIGAKRHYAGTKRHDVCPILIMEPVYIFE